MDFLSPTVSQKWKLNIMTAVLRLTEPNPSHNLPQHILKVAHVHAPSSLASSGLHFNHFYLLLTETNLEVDDDGTDEHADALEQVSDHVHERCAHAGVGLLRPVS